MKLYKVIGPVTIRLQSLKRNIQSICNLVLFNPSFRHHLLDMSHSGRIQKQHQIPAAQCFSLL